MMFWRKSKPTPATPAIPIDPRATIVDELREAYPFGAEALGMRSLIRLVVYVVFELKKRELI